MSPAEPVKSPIETVSTSSTESCDDQVDTQPRIGHSHEAPAFMLNNKYIHRGYRINHTSYKHALSSLFTVHNESVNVWTHFIGFKVFIAIIVFLVYFKQ